MEILPEDIRRLLDYADLLMKPALEEVGGIIGDQVKAWRYKNQLRLIEKVKEIHSNKGIESPRSIPVKTLGNLLNFSSYEEDENIKEKWANLLANATDPSNEFNEHFTLVNILKELTADEVMVLDFMYEKSVKWKSDRPQECSENILRSMAIKNGAEDYNRREDQEREAIILDSLIRNRLIKPVEGEIKDKRRDYGSDYSSGYYLEKSRKIILTNLGWRLVQECSNNENISSIESLP